METKKAYKSFRYANNIVWKSPHRAVLSAGGKPDIAVGSPPEFRGFADQWSPEDMLVGSLNTCLMLTFFALAQSKGVTPVAYESGAEGVLENVDGKYRITEVTVAPRITLKSEEDATVARQLMAEKVEANCFITNSISGKVRLTPEFRLVA